ncbi:hypothetical protein BDW71DRAFT_217431 [Aspergillus fruticulosus]
MPSPPKSYRRPRRPPAHLRTKTGCLTCRRRRKKCDEQPDRCKNCSRRWLQCIWPSPTAGAASDAIQVPPSMALLSRSPAVSRPTESTGLGGRSGMELSAPVLYPEPTTLPFYVGVIPTSSSPLFELLRAKWLRQLIRPLAAGSLIELYHQESMATAMSIPYYMHALLACCAAEYPVENVNALEHFWRLSEKHYVRAITGLREALSASGPITHSGAIIQTVLILCIFERAKPWPSSGVGAHLSGLAQLIRSESVWGALDCPVSASGTAISRVVLEGFIFHSATSVPFQPFPDQQSNLDVAMRIAQSRLEAMFGEGNPAYPDSPVLGVQPKLFVLVREVSLMHREHELAHVNYIRRLEHWQRITELQEQLSRYRHFYSTDLYCFSEPMAMEIETPPPSLHRATCSCNPHLIGPMLYIVAAELLLADVLEEARGHYALAISELVQEGIQFVNQLQPASDYYAEYYGWPIYVLAKFVSRKEDRDCVLSQVNAFWQATRSGTMSRLADMLGNGY